MRPIALAGLLLSGFAVEHAAEQISKQVIHISAFKVERMESTILSIAALWARTGAACPTSVKRRVTILIIQRFLFRIAQYTIRLCNLLKALLRRRIILIHIRMIFFCKFSICFFNRIGIGAFGNAEHFVIISLCCHCCLHSARAQTSPDHFRGCLLPVVDPVIIFVLHVL